MSTSFAPKLILRNTIVFFVRGEKGNHMMFFSNTNDMPKLCCKNYGFDCDFEVEGEDLPNLSKVFGNHTALEHRKRYEKESLVQFIIGSICTCPYCNSKFESKEQLSKHIDGIHHGPGFLDMINRQFL